ncbi:MAG TPA: hypothetical protein DCQ83_02485 [Fibrobacteres bacterium]|jgi:hypothetical protein|nr:hypothetical protein [Fibrobacterota bacterium]
MAEFKYPFRICMGWLLLATFCLHLNGCYNTAMIPVDRIRTAGEDPNRTLDSLSVFKGRAIVIWSGEKAGILTHPRWTEYGLEGTLHNPFLLVSDTTSNMLGAFSSRNVIWHNQMPPQSNRMDLFLKDKNTPIDSLFNKTDTRTASRSIFLPWESIDHINRRDLNVVATWICVAPSVAVIVFSVLVLSVISDSEFGLGL